MARSTNWEKFHREQRLNYYPSQRAQPATQKQLDYIRGLAVQKGQSMPRLPKTKKGASDHIERLLALADVEASKVVPRLVVPSPPPKPNDRQELVMELRERFPQLTPMTANSMVQLFSQLDEIAMAFVFDGLMAEETPEDQDALILHILRRFLEEFGDVTDDDSIRTPASV